MSARINTAAERARLDGLTGHDPAPWCTEDDEWDGRCVTTLERLNEPLVPIAKVGVDYDEPFESRQKACANLIAAAPDLLVGYRAALDEIDRLTAALAEATIRERDRIAISLEQEAEMTPCAEDASVVRGCARLIRADFSYDDADADADDQPGPGADSSKGNEK